MLTGIWAWVWNTLPDADGLNGYDGALVKAANGNGHVGDGFDFRANYARWDSAFPGRCVPWTWLYATTDGATAADQLLAAAPHATTFVLDVEGDDPSGQAVAPRIVTDCVARLRAKRPGCQVGFTSYPLRSQATAHGAPWDTMVAACDFGLPQVYYPSQARQLDQVVADHRGKPVCVAFSPGDDPNWTATAQTCLTTHGAVSLWRHPYTRAWRNTLTPGPTPPTPPTPFTEDDVLKLYRADGATALYVTNGLTKVHLPTQAHVDFYVGEGLLTGRSPKVVDHAFLDAIPEAKP